MSKRYVDNPANRKLGRVGMVHGTAVQSRLSSSSSSSKTYVNNAMNQRLGRVGLPHGTAVVSSGSSSSSKTYVDNSTNQRLGRVGMPHGTAVVSRSGTNNSSSKTYVDNPTNHRFGPVGLPHGTGSDGKLASQLNALCLIDRRVYKDNQLNRKLGRVGKPLRSMPQSSQSQTQKVYVDNSYNRKHNRVGKPLGSVPISKEERVYKDNVINRELGRVGKPWGTYKKKNQAELLKKLRELPKDDDLPDEFVEKYRDDEAAQEFIQTYLEIINRENHIRDRLEENKVSWHAHQHTSKTIIDKYKGKVINYGDLKLVSQIGHGSYGDVFMAEWINDELVAVKKLKNQNFSKKRLQLFEAEIQIFCKLEHTNVVQFLGACLERPNLAIVMEYMDKSLHDALHITAVDFSEVEKISIMRDVSRGLSYLHDKQLAHCDLKTLNVLLNNLPGEETALSEETVLAKITDFGLSLMKSDTETSASSHAVCNIGTPRYSAPEVLSGEMLNVTQLMQADIYSMGLVILELLLEEIAFEDLTLSQLRKQVGENGLKPSIKSNFLDPELQNILSECWSTSPKERPSAHSLMLFAEKCDKLYAEN